MINVLFSNNLFYKLYLIHVHYGKKKHTQHSKKIVSFFETKFFFQNDNFRSVLNSFDLKRLSFFKG